MSYDTTKTFDKADEEMDKEIKRKEERTEARKKIDISWKELFPDPTEKVYAIMKNGVIFRATSHDEKKVHMGFRILEKEIKKRGYKIEDIEIVVHNHRKEKSFSRSDYKQYWTLGSQGFDGKFLMYCHRTKEAYDMNKEQIKNK